MGDKGNNIFARMFRSRAAPRNAISTTPVVSFGRATAGVSVNENNALTTAAVYACTRVIAEAVAGLPLNVYRYENGGVIIYNEHPLYDILHTSPNPEMTSFVFRESLMSHLLLWGNGYAQIIRDGKGRVTALYPLLPNKIDVNRNEAGELFYNYWRDYDETRPKEKSGGVILRRDQVLHIPGLSYDGLVGYSPIELANNAISMARATERYGAEFFTSGANPAGVLEMPGAIGDPIAVQESWERSYRGIQNAHRIAVLEDGAKFRPISIPPETAQFLETRKFQLNEIARVFRVPPHMIGDLEKSTFANIEQQSLEFVKFTLEPWLVRLEQGLAISLLTPAERKNVVIRFNLDGLLRGDYSTRIQGYESGLKNGWLSVNDVRRLENMNPIPALEGGDKYLVNGNTLELKDAGGFFQRNEGAV